jgi:type I thyroxine 5'-deiodinase
VEALHRRVRASVDVTFVYVVEAHPVDEWQLPANVEDGVLLRQQTSLDARRATAREAAARLSLTMPVLVDGMDNAAAAAFAAWPERLVVVDANGLIAHPGRPGPSGFDPDEAARCLESLTRQPAP